jgi:GNAT superfamily N-acetyltransferase
MLGNTWPPWVSTTLTSGVSAALTTTAMRTRAARSDPGTSAPSSANPAAASSAVKRIWTHSAHRRRGLARFVLRELEALAARRGYRAVYLTTGPRQPEAKHLYLNTGYEPQFDLAADPETIGPLAFTKDLRPPSG